MAKNKTLSIILLVLFMLVLMVVLASAIFCVGNVELVWYNTPSKCADLTVEKVILDSGMKSNENVFTLDRTKYIANIEKKDEYLKVLSYEVVWPNNIRIHIMEREEVYCIPMNDNSYLITDSDFKVLRKGVGDYSSTAENCIVIQGRNGYQNNTYIKGDFIPSEYFVDYLDLQDSFASCGENLVSYKALIKSATIQENTLIMTTFLGVKIEILNSAYYNTTKLRTALAVLDTLTASEYSTGSIYVFKNDLNRIEGRYNV